MLHPNPALLVLVASGLILTLPVRSAEPWSDDRLPVQETLEFWFDCTVQTAARRSHDLPPLGAQSSADFLLDGSGRARHLAQPSADARPRFHQDSRTAFLTFDGANDALAATHLHGEVTHATVFLVASPRANGGGFRGFFSLARRGGNDYVTGMNLDLGPQASSELSFLNVEGSGAVGAGQLLRGRPAPFGAWHMFTVQYRPGRQSIRLSLDGEAQGARDRREDSTVGLNVFSLGARYYSNSGEPPFVQSFFDGSIAELLFYGRALSESEIHSVEQYLQEKHAALFKPAEAAPEELAFEPASLEIPGAPPPRKRAEVERLLKGLARAGGAEKKESRFHIVLCAGPKDHGPGEHDYPLWQRRWSRLLGMAESVQVSTAWEWPSPEQLREAQVIVFFSNNPGWSKERAAQLDAVLARGGGLVYIHYAVDGHDEVEALADCIGLAWRGGHSKFRHGALSLKLEPGPITAGLDSPHFIDESYWNLVGDFTRCQLIASGIEEGQPQPLIWSRTQGQGRVFVNILGHYNWTFDDPIFRILMLRGICWAGGEPVDRLSQLALIGARVED